MMKKEKAPQLSSTAIAIIEMFSWYGVLAILGAYMLTALSIMSPNSYTVIFLNGSGALALFLDAWKDKNWQPVVLNIIWIAVALFALIRLFV